MNVCVCVCLAVWLNEWMNELTGCMAGWLETRWQLFFFFLPATVNLFIIQLSLSMSLPMHLPIGDPWIYFSLSHCTSCPSIRGANATSLRPSVTIDRVMDTWTLNLILVTNGLNDTPCYSSLLPRMEDDLPCDHPSSAPPCINFFIARVSPGLSVRYSLYCLPI